MAQAIDFHTVDIEFDLPEQDNLRLWIQGIVKRNKLRVKHLNFIFCSDTYLLNMNREHLSHDEYTDILTFPLHADGSKDLEGDIFISLDRVKDNAAEMGVNDVDELHRVMIHGVLHLVGYDDKDAASKTEMRKAEDLALALRMF